MNEYWLLISWLKSVLSRVTICLGSELCSSIIRGRTSLTSTATSHCSTCSAIFFMFSGDAMTVTCLSETCEIVLTVSGDMPPAVPRPPKPPYER